MAHDVVVNQIQRSAALALDGLVHLLAECDEAHWTKWARGQLGAARSGRLSPEILNMYGGMGRFDDLVLAAVNGHAVNAQQEPWANQLLNVLSQRVYDLASALNDENPNVEWAIPSRPSLTGMRCLVCGHSQLTQGNIEWWTAGILVPDLVTDATLEAPEAIVSTVLTGKVAGASELWAGIVAKARASNIDTDAQGDGMRLCVACGSADTAVWRWHDSDDGLLPDADNLELRKKGHKYRPDTTVSELATALEEHEASLIATGLWQLPRKPQSSLDISQTKLLDIVRGLEGSTYLSVDPALDKTGHCSRELDWIEQIHGWRRVSCHTWLVPVTTHSRTALHHAPMRMNWYLYVGSTPIPETDLPNLHGLENNEAPQRLRDFGITALIDATHNNTIWRVAISN